jgi:hypothetical protein
LTFGALQDSKPFRVRIVSPPPAKLLDETFHLPPRTHNGDKITIGEREFVVSSVRWTYSFQGGRYRLDTKQLDVATAGRYKVNEKLDKLLSDQSQKKKKS